MNERIYSFMNNLLLGLYFLGWFFTLFFMFRVQSLLSISNPPKYSWLRDIIFSVILGLWPFIWVVAIVDGIKKKVGGVRKKSV